MTIDNIISWTHSENKAAYTDDQVRALVINLEERLFREIECTHEGGRDSFEIPEDGELLAPDAFSKMYRDYVDAQIYLLNGDFNRYNTYAPIFDNSYSEFEKWYNSQHLPLQSSSITF